MTDTETETNTEIDKDVYDVCPYLNIGHINYSYSNTELNLIIEDDIDADIFNNLNDLNDLNGITEIYQEDILDKIMQNILKYMYAFYQSIIS